MKNGKIFNNLRSSKGRTIGFGPINEGSSPSLKTNIYIIYFYIIPQMWRKRFAVSTLKPHIICIYGVQWLALQSSKLWVRVRIPLGTPFYYYVSIV